jgi:hypothetical protein
MIFEDGWRSQACKDATWAFFIDRLGADTYALRHKGEVSLVDAVMLKKFLSQLLLGGRSELGGDDVGRA